MPDLQFQAELREKNTSALRVLAWLSSTLVPLFWALDWVLIPKHVVLLGLLRLGLMFYGAWLLMALSRKRQWVTDHVDFLGPATILAIEATISGMCWLHEGYESQYYAGISLSVLASGTLFIWTLKRSIIVYVVMFTIYMLPLAVGALGITNFATVLNNQFFIISTIVIVVASQASRYHLEYTEFFTKRSLGETKASLESALDRLRELDKAKSNFFNNVTHELRTPLTMILSPLENILSGDLGRIEAGHAAALKLIWRNALKLLKLINDLLDLAKLEDQHLQLRREPVDIGKQVKDILDHTAPLAARKDIDVVFEYRAPAEGFHLDPEKMERVFVNIISNALKFTEPGGVVRVVVAGTPDAARIAVSDTGVGIAPENLDLVFERFSQGDASVTRRFGGTGIGLAFAREITQLHGGNIEVQSEVGVGSTFTVVLPRGVADAPRSESPIRRDGPVEWAQQLLERPDFRFLDLNEVTERRVVERTDDRGKATKVLVVEDNVELLRFLHLQLQDQHAVYLAQNGAAGLELALRERPDVIVSDYMMDTMDGLTMIRELRANPATADIPVILLTAEQSVETRTAAHGVGADVYLGKPFNSRELRAAVEGQLKRRGREVQQALRAQARSLESVSAGLAHEIRNPLTYIKNAVFVIAESVGNVQKTLRSESLDAAAKQATIQKTLERMERMRTTADRGIERVEQVLETVRRYAREGYPETRMPGQIDLMVKDVVSLLRPKTDRHIEIQVEAGSNGVMIECVADEVQQVLRNLIQNAVDASPDDSVVVVSTLLERGGVVLQVKDHGHGIPRDIQNRVFTPFFSTKAPGQGMGLGLAIVDQVVREHGGTVELDSVEDVGTTFRVWFPASRTAMETATATATAA